MAASRSFRRGTSDAARTRSGHRPRRRHTKRFGAVVAVRELSLSIERGSAFGLIGPNGAGKTTAFSLMAGYVRPSHGRVEVFGFAPSRLSELRGRLGILPQDANLPAADRVDDFLLYMARLQGLPRAAEAARAVLAEVGAESFCRKRCGALSHGMTKRVALAQALLGDPELLLLDEPTAGLDPRSAYEVREMMRRRKGRATLVVSSHNLAELEDLCDAAAILDRGGLIASDSMTGLTMASEQIRVNIAPGPVPLETLGQLPLPGRVELDSAASDLVVHFDARTTDAETVIGQVLMLLLQSGARISGVTKGRGLERRVLDLTQTEGRGGGVTTG